MTRGIIRAADRVAIWREVAEEPKFDTPSSRVTPPSAPGPSEPEPVGEVIVPQSNEFKYLAAALKKVLDTHLVPGGSLTPPHSSKILSDWLDTHEAFHSYIKPQYADALKAALGIENYNKLLHYMPEEHHQALTTHTQRPALKSKQAIKNVRRPRGILTVRERLDL